MSKRACLYVCALAGVLTGRSGRADEGTVAGGIGPDIVVSRVSHDNIRNWGSEFSDGTLCEDPDELACTAAFSIGTTSCNLGDETALWISDSNQHPVIRQNMYRLLNGRFEQIGTSWVKHGFLAVNNEADCAPACVNPGTQNGADNLRPGCSDPYGSGLNGNHRYLGPSSVVNAFTGFFPGPPTGEGGTGTLDRRIQVSHVDLNLGLNLGGRYFGEGQYVSADEAQAGNGENSISYKNLDIFILGQDMSGGFSIFCATPYCAWDVGSTFVGDPAIRAWAEIDPAVRLTDARVPGEGLFVLGAKVTDLGTGFWRYEYALFNLNSDRSGGWFEVPVPDGAIVTNVGFHDINYHSGEPWDGTDWTHEVSGQQLRWSTTPYDVNSEANALRWSTLYNFRLEVNAPPEDSSVILGLFKPGQPERIAIDTNAPRLTLVDCNENGIADQCDVACVIGCDPKTCAAFDDCNSNGIPDACEADCNGNGISDSCDIADCQGDPWCGDCNGNTAPDICDADCDADGVPDDCEPVPDFDGDGVDDCDDQCPFTTPPDACLPDQDVVCRRAEGDFCFLTTRSHCIALGGDPVCGDPVEDPCGLLPVCPDSKCRDGCLIGDYDLDGDVDFVDIGTMQMCFSGEAGSAKYTLPSPECLHRFDFDADEDIDLDDYSELLGVLSGP